MSFSISKKEEEKEEKEYRKIQKLIKEKKADDLGKWLEDFAGDFPKEKMPKEKTSKDDWL